MQGRTFDARWALALPAIAIAAAVLIVLSRAGAGEPRPASAVADPTRVSRTLGAREFRAPAAAPTATLAESLRAADILIKAGKMAPPPTLAESWLAGAALIKAGVIPAPTPTLGETWLAVDAMIKAGVLPTPPWMLNVAPTPTLRETLEAAVVLVKAGAMPPPPSLAADQQAQVAPPASLPATSTPVPPTSTPLPPTKTPTVVAKTATAAASRSGWYDDAYTAQVFSLVNQRRQAAGLPPLAVEPRLANSAATYAKVLADSNTFSHTGPDGSTLVTRDEAAGFPFTVQIGEVLAWGSSGWTPGEIVQAWMDSPPHREEIMSPVYTRAGAGCYFTNNGTLMVRCAMELAAG